MKVHISKDSFSTLRTKFHFRGTALQTFYKSPYSIEIKFSIHLNMFFFPLSLLMINEWMHEHLITYLNKTHRRTKDCREFPFLYKTLGSYLSSPNPTHNYMYHNEWTRSCHITFSVWKYYLFLWQWSRLYRYRFKKKKSKISF